MNSQKYLQLLVCLVAVCAAGYAQTGAISGVFKTNDGKSVAAVIRATRVMPTPASPATMTTAADGKFSFSGLTPGLYQLCASVPAGGYIDICLWEPSGLVVSVSAGKTTPVTLQVNKSSKLRIHVNDPAHLLQSPGNGKAKPDRYLVMGVVASGGRFYPVTQTAEDANGKDHEVAVPFDRRFTFVLKPVGLSVTDSANAAVPATGVSVTQSHKSNGPAPPTLTFTIQGKS